MYKVFPNHQVHNKNQSVCIKWLSLINLSDLEKIFHFLKVYLYKLDMWHFIRLEIRDSRLCVSAVFFWPTKRAGSQKSVLFRGPGNRLLIFCPHMWEFLFFCDICQNGHILSKYWLYIGNITQYLLHFGEIGTLMVYSRDPTGSAIYDTTTTYPWKERCNFGL